MGFTPNETAILDEINTNTLEGIAAVAQVQLRCMPDRQCPVRHPWPPCWVPMNNWVSIWPAPADCVQLQRLVPAPQAAPRVLFMRAFAHLFEAKPSGLNTLNILRSNPHMIELQQSINQAVIDDFAAAKEAVRVSGAGATSW